MHFAARQPSSAWEPISVVDEPQRYFWAWFKPPGAPQGLSVRIPEETFRNSPTRQPVTMRQVLRSLAIAPTQLAAWTLYGVQYDGQFGANPALDYAIPEPGLAPDPTIGIFLNPAVPAVPAPPAAVPPASAPPGAGDADYEGLFSQMHADWNFALQLEIQLVAAGNQLNATLSRLNSLNRDLSPDEDRFADQLDRKAWLDARRWMRDVSSRLSRFIKEQYIGMTSIAGTRGTYEAIYRDYVVPRKHFPGIEQAQRDFEAHRKASQILLTNMNVAQSSAAQDGERRAQQILSKIAAKVRAERSKK